MLKTKVIIAGLVALPLLGVVGCGTSNTSTANAATNQTQTIAAKKSVPKPPSTAKAIVAALKKTGLPVGKTDVYTAENDPNKLLGRPGEYTSKVNFVDTRVKEAISGGVEVTNGGSVEVFANAKNAKTRYQYVSSIAQSAPMFNEYDYLDGKVVLRVSHDLTPTQAKKYLADLKKVLK